MPTTTERNVLIFAYGSGGDVYPNIAIGKTLQDRGHRVAIVTNPYFEKAVSDTGVEFVACGTEEEARATIENPELWQRGKGLRVLIDGVLKAMPETYRIVRDRYVPGRTVVVANALGFGARVAHDRLGVPLATVHLQPILLRSLNEQPGVVVPKAMQPLVRPMRRMLTAALDRWVFDPLILPRLNAFRRELDLPPVERVFKEWVHSPQLVIGLFPDWFAEPQPDWPPNTRLTTFPLFDQAEGSELSPELVQWLDDGPPPLVFTMGTAMVFARRFFEVSAEASHMLGRRALLLTRFPEQLPKTLPAGVLHVPFAPFSALLPRAAAMIHHGGIGTLSQGLAAGVPQLIVPMNFDQPDNAARLRRLGAGDSMRQPAYRPRAVAHKLDALLRAPSVSSTCRACAEKLRGREPIVETCEWIESLDWGVRESMPAVQPKGAPV